MALIKHIGIIPDGTRRWARMNHFEYSEAYMKSMNKLLDVMDFFFNIKQVKSMSIYMLSDNNLKRAKEELSPVIAAENHFLNKILPELCPKISCKVSIAGETSLLPANLAESAKNISKETKTFKEHNLYLLVGYNPFHEISYSIKERNKDICIENLWVPENVDLVIRTAGGRIPLSNFLPLQCGYAQVFIAERLFNDITLPDLDEIYEKALEVETKLGA
jgi:undecaprenyl diphosphate synthase